MCHDPRGLSLKMRIELTLGEMPEAFEGLNRRYGGRARLLEAVDQKRPVDFLFQQLRAPERLLHFLRTHEHDPAHAEGGELRQEALHRARTRRREDEVEPRLEGRRLVRTAHGHGAVLYPLDDGRADGTVEHARLEGLSLRAVQHGQHMLGADVRKGRPSAVDFTSLEQDTIHTSP